MITFKFYYIFYLSVRHSSSKCYFSNCTWKQTSWTLWTYVENCNHFKQYASTINISLTSVWVSDCCLTPNKLFFSYIKTRTNYLRLYSDVRFVLDQYAKLDFFSANSLKQQSPPVRHVTAIGCIIPNRSQTVFTLSH
jgi:hypothetical protein